MLGLAEGNAKMTRIHSVCNTFLTANAHRFLIATILVCISSCALRVTFGQGLTYVTKLKPKKFKMLTKPGCISNMKVWVTFSARNRVQLILVSLYIDIQLFRHLLLACYRRQWLSIQSQWFFKYRDFHLLLMFYNWQYANMRCSMQGHEVLLN